LYLIYVLIKKSCPNVPSDNMELPKCRRDVTRRGSSFQTRAAATGKARSPTVDNRVWQTSVMMIIAERRWPRASKSKDQRNSW